MEQKVAEERFGGAMSDEEYIRNTDYKQFDPDDGAESLQSSYFIREVLRQEYRRDYKLDPSMVAMNNVPRCDFPFNRHTVTIGIGNVIIDFETARRVHEKITEEQRRFADEIEKVKEEMEKVRIIEKAWYDDYLNDKYINDLTAEQQTERSRGVGDACVPAQDTLKVTVEKQIHIDKQGILHVQDVRGLDNESSPITVKPKARHIVQFKENVVQLPKASVN